MKVTGLQQQQQQYKPEIHRGSCTCTCSQQHA